MCLLVTAAQTKTQSRNCDIKKQEGRQTCCMLRLVCDGEYGPPRSFRRRLSLCILVLRQVMYRLQKSLQSSLTFSNSNRWILNT